MSTLLTTTFPSARDHHVLNADDIQEDVEGGVDNDNDDHSYNRLVTFNKDCCVRTVLIIVVVTTAIVLVVIVASYREKEDTMAKTKASSTESVYWVTNKAHSQLVFEHQFLLRHLSNQHPSQIMAFDDVRRMYVIMWDEVDKYFNLYMIVDFEKNMETFLVVSKSENTYATDVEENTVLFCHTKRFDRAFHGNFAAVSDMMASSSLEAKFSHTKLTYAVNYIGGPLTLEPFISTVVNSSCEDLPKTDVFKWSILDESLACGERVYSETELESCSRDMCQTFPGIPLSKGKICHKFRSCNFVQRYCDPYYRQNPGRTDNHPYCVCRKTAAEDARGLSCPRVADDDGECEIPRRDLLVTQGSLPCLCLYKFYVVYPYTSASERAINLQQVNAHDQKRDILKWYVKEETVTGPALMFSQCPC